jgi:hypothetical protein
MHVYSPFFRFSEIARYESLHCIGGRNICSSRNDSGRKIMVGAYDNLGITTFIQNPSNLLIDIEMGFPTVITLR